MTQLSRSNPLRASRRQPNHFDEQVHLFLGSTDHPRFRIKNLIAGV